PLAQRHPGLPSLVLEAHGDQGLVAVPVPEMGHLDELVLDDAAEDPTEPELLAVPAHAAPPAAARPPGSPALGDLPALGRRPVAAVLGIHPVVEAQAARRMEAPGDDQLELGRSGAELTSSFCGDAHRASPRPARAVPIWPGAFSGTRRGGSTGPPSNAGSAPS